MPLITLEVTVEEIAILRQLVKDDIYTHKNWIVTAVQEKRYPDADVIATRIARLEDLQTTTRKAAEKR